MTKLICTCICGKHKMSAKEELKLLEKFREDIYRGVFGTKNRVLMIQRVEKLIEDLKSK